MEKIIAEIVRNLLCQQVLRKISKMFSPSWTKDMASPYLIMLGLQRGKVYRKKSRIVKVLNATINVK